MKKLLTLFVVLIATCALWADNIITYTASQKLAETTDNYSDGLHTNAFNVSITSHAFSNGTGTITFASDVTSIGKYAFRNCSGLTSITIPNSVTSIGNCAFGGCSGLTSITIPNSVRSIGEFAFSDCSGLTSITIPNSVTSIGGQAFDGCSGLTSITIPNSVRSIGDYAFYGCSGLTSIVWNAKNCPSAPFSEIASQITNFTIGDEVVSIPASLCGRMSKLTTITIPNSVTSIGDYAFCGCSGLTSIVVESGNTKYDSRDNCNAIIETASNTLITGCKNTTIPNSVTSIGEYAFYECSGLTSIKIGNSVTSIGEWAFGDCSGLTSIVVESGNTKYDSRDNCNAIIETASNTLITGCKNTTIPNSVKSIGTYAFYGSTGLTSVTIPNSITSIGDYAFYGCSGLTSIVWNAENCPNAPFGEIASQITNFTIGDEVVSIPASLCSGMSKLTTITIPNSVTSIGSGAFYGCSGLTSIVWNAENCPSAPFSLIASQITNFAIGDEVVGIPASLCSGMSKLTTITIPNSVTSIGDYAFYGCSGLTSIVWNAENCPSAPFSVIASQITNFTIGDEVVSIPASLCRRMSKLTTITIPNSVTSIGSGAFYGCTSLKTIYNHSKLYINKGETNYGYIGYYADTIYNYYCGEELIWEYEDGKLVITGTGDMYDFAENAMPWYMYRDSIKSIIINDGVTSIGTYAFSGLSKRGNFTQIAFPSSLLSIGEYAFAGDSYLKSIHFGASVESIGDYAFQGCTRVSEMTCLSELTPEITSKALEDISSDAYLYVPSNYLREYQLDPNWKRFVLMTLGAETTTATDVTVTPYDNEALFTWPISDNAATYTIEITKDGVVFCTLVFNANGQLTGIAFAPARNGSHNTPSAQVSATGMSFTVTGLSTASHYAYSIQAKSANNQVIASYSGEFSTNGYVETPTAIDDETTVNKYVNTATKLLRDGQLFILRDGNAPATYNMQGAVVNL